jgi:hypothetical protein
LPPSEDIIHGIPDSLLGYVQRWTNQIRGGADFVCAWSRADQDNVEVAGGTGHNATTRAMCTSSHGTLNINMEELTPQAGKIGKTINGKIQDRGLQEDPSHHGNELKAQDNVCRSSHTKVSKEM